MNKNWPFVLCFGLSGILAHATTNPPSAPLIANPQAGLAWTIEALPSHQRTLPPGESETAKTPIPADPGSSYVEVENEMGEGFLKQRIQTRKDHFLVRYVVGRLVVFQDDESGNFFLSEMDEGVPGGEVSTKEFAGFEWLDLKWWVGEQEVDGVRCDVYVAPWPLPTEGDTSPAHNSPGHYLAAIGKSDKLPRRLETPFLVRRYLPGKSKETTLPAEVREVLQSFRAYVEENRAVSFRFAE